MSNIPDIIETERLILREWTKGDINALVDGLGNFEVSKYLTVPFPYTEKDAIEFVNSHNKNSDKKLYFAIIKKDTKEVIGGTNLSINEDGTNSGGIWLNSKFQGFGFGTEVWKARAKFAFDVLKVDKLFNGYYEFNDRSAKMQKKIGYRIVGEQMRYCPALNNEVKEIRTVLLKENFKN